MSDAFPPCTDGTGWLTTHPAEGVIRDPDGVIRGYMCESCARAVVEEYREKLGQTWTFGPRDAGPVDAPASGQVEMPL